jgi:hypothetical protein
VAVDGTFMRGGYVQTLLLAVALDAENQIIILAWAVVESENESSWRWFLSQLTEAIGDLDVETTTLISDRDKGLQAADNQLAYAKRAFCTQHIASNVQTKFGIEARRKFVAATYARTVEQYDTAMQTLRETHGGAYMYIIAIDKTLWAAPFMEAKRWGHMTSNMVESINSGLNQDRDLSIIDLLNAIWNRCMGQRYARFQDAVQKLAVPGARYTSFALQLLTEAMNHSQHRRVEAASETRGVVTSHSDKQYVVHLEARTCTCGRFEINDIPCGHAVALILRLRKQPRDTYQRFSPWKPIGGPT